MIRHLGIVTNLLKPFVHEALGSAVEAAQRHGLALSVALPEAESLGMALPALPEVELPQRVDAVVTFGGDGTFLRAARIVGDAGTPLLGINLGSLGFLAEVRVSEIPEAMADVAHGRYQLEKRRKIGVEVWREGERVFSATALNDVALNMGGVPRAIDVQVSIEGTHVGRYLSDGLVVATPTGSTAYNLSAGGPIVHPAVDAIVLTPICPHSLGVRPIILDDRHPIEIELLDCDGAIVSADGQVSSAVRAGDHLRFVRTPECSYFLRLPGRNLYRIIRQKLKWGGPRDVEEPEEGEGRAP